MTAAPRLVHRTAHLRLRLTRRQACRCYRLLRSAGDVWAWLLDSNRRHHQQGEPAISNYQALCRQLTGQGPFGELSVTGARSVLQRYNDACFQAAKRRKAGQQDAGFPRRKRALVPVRFYQGTFLLEGSRVRLPVARGRPELWVRLARPLPYPPAQVRAVTLLADGGRLWLAVTAAVPIQQHDLDPGRVAGVDLGIIHPYAVVTQDAALLVSGRALRAENYLHLKDQQARRAKAARRAPTPGQRGSRRWRRHRARLRRAEARHRRRIHQAQHQAAKQVVAFAVQQGVDTLLVGDPNGITKQAAGRAADLPAPGCQCWWSTGVPVLVEHRRAGMVPARRDRRRHLHDARRRWSCLASGHPPDDRVSGGCRSLGVLDLAPGEDQATFSTRAHVA
jgi:putative transposase